MRIRLQLLLPVLVGVLVGAGFLVAAVTVGHAVAGSLTTVPGLTRGRSVEVAVRAVVVAGTVVTLAAVIAAALIARLVTRPLLQMREATDRLAGPVQEPDTTTPVAEIQDLARGIGRAAGELRDRHDRELRERTELAALVESVSEGIVQLDARGRIARMNAASHTLLGLPEDAVGRPIHSMLRSARLRDLVARSASRDELEVSEVVVDDRRILVTASRQPDGSVVATFVDLTDLRRLEEVRRDFVANASHELKTPLTSIRGYTETLMAGGLPEAEGRQFLATIARNAERLQRIVDDLLDLSRLESGKWRPELEPVHMVEAAESCWLAFAERAEARDVGFVARAADDDVALADRRAIEQVFSNLFDNALRYTPERGRIRVTAAPDPDGPPENGSRRPARPGGTPPVEDDPDRRWLRVDVADSGTGIPRDALPRIFERFYRVDPARSREEGGTGLGLSIVRHMLESMGGAVQARSELGKGTTIRIWLRRA